MTASIPPYPLPPMPDGEPPIPDTPPETDGTDDAPKAGADPLDLAARAILGYLDDLAACRELCQRYDASASVLPEQYALHLVVAVELTSEGELAQVRGELATLPSAGRWRGGAVAENGEQSASGRKVIARHVLWEGEPLYVAVTPEGFGLLRVDLFLARRPEMLRLPLRAAASGLRCLERLLTAGIVRAAPLSDLAASPKTGLLDALRRITPENLPSSQCIWPCGAEQSPTPARQLPPPS